jgi:hypothetical protein
MTVGKITSGFRFMVFYATLNSISVISRMDINRSSANGVLVRIEKKNGQNRTPFTVYDLFF